MQENIFRSPKKRGRIAVFLSGRGSNFLAIHEAISSNNINAEIQLVFSNRKEAPGILYAQDKDLKTLHLQPKAYDSREAYDQDIARKVIEHDIDLICLAGYMKILTPGFCHTFRNKIMNIHPALLPAFPGLHVQQSAIDWGVRFSGATVHFVEPEVDMGPIITQAVVPVLQDDTEETLSSRILKEEHRIYPEAIRLYFEGRIRVQGRRVFII